MSSTLELESVSKTYPSADTPAVEGVDLQVREGEVLTLLGESGSGKTTLLRLVAGLEEPSSGQVKIGNQSVAGDDCWVPPERRGVGLVFQDGALFPHLSVTRNVEYGLRQRPAEERSGIVASMIALVRLNGLEERFPQELSGGERQRLALARALAPSPNVILLDEPFSSLDRSLRRSVRQDLRRILQEAGTTAILVTHDPDDALEVGDRVSILRSGRIRQTGTPGDVYRRPLDEYCARLFGPINRVEQDENSVLWIRPEQMTFLSREKPGALAVEVEDTRDTGRHVEATVRPRAQKDGPRWMVYVESKEIPSTGWIQFDPPA